MKLFTSLLAAALAIPAAAAVPPPGEIYPDTEDHPGTSYILKRDCQAFWLEAYEAIRERSYGSIVELTDADDGYVYFKYIISEYPCETSVKAERDGDRIIIRGPQALYEEYDYSRDDWYTVYLVPLTQQIIDGVGYAVADEDMEFVFNVLPDGTLVSADPTKILGACLYTYLPYMGEEGYHWTGYGDNDITISKIESTVITPPADAETVKWVWEDDYETTMVNLIFRDKDVYIQGMDRNLPEAWIKGSITADNQIEFPSGQYMGADMGYLYLNYFCGAEFEEVDNEDSEGTHTEAKLAPSAIFRYDAEAQSMHTVNGYLINSSAEHLYPLFFYQDVVIEVQNRDPKAPPAAPYDLYYYNDDLGQSLWMMIPNTDVDGNILNEDNLYYEVFLDGDPYELDIEYDGIEEHPTWVPYNFQSSEVFVLGKDHTVYFYAEGAETYGVRSIYINEEGEILYSAPCGDVYAAVESVGDAKEVAETLWFDLTGRRIVRPADGLAIRTIIYTDGTRRTEKVIL